MLEMARRAKHHAFLLQRSLVKSVDRRLDIRRDAYPKFDPYVYDPGAYQAQVGDTVVPTSWTFPVNHLLHPPTRTSGSPKGQAPNVAYVFWTGENDMPQTRQTALEGLRGQNPEINIELVTPNNLSDYVVKHAPLHPAYEYLSFVHRSDYLRSYFMHFHGGAYVDLKPLSGPISHLITQVNSSENVWACGPSELSKFNSSPSTGRLGRDQRKYYRQCIAQYMFAFKPGSSWTYDWYAEVQRRMSYFQDLLVTNPAQDAYGRLGGYPVPWNSLHGIIFTPLALKYIKYSSISNSTSLLLNREYR